VALFRQRSVADEECFARGVDDLGCEGVEAVHRLNALDLGEEPIDEAEVAPGDSDDGRDCGRMRDLAVGHVGCNREATHEYRSELVGGQRSVLVGESDSAVELRVAGETFLDAGHADQDDAHVVSVEVVADLLEAGCFEPVGLVDDEQFGTAAGAGFIVDVGIDDAMLGVVEREGDLLAGPWEALVDLTDGSSDGRGEECRTSLQDAFGYWAEVVGENGPSLFPVVGSGVVTGGQCFADSWWSPAEVDVAVGADGVGELREAAMFACGLEGGAVRAMAARRGSPRQILR